MSHARLSPSAASRWTKCPGSIRLIESRNVQDRSSMAAEEGTAAHELLEKSLQQEKPPITFLGEVFNKCDLKPEGFIADKTMCDFVDDAYQWCVDYVEKHSAVIYEERKINPGKMFDREDCTGTADVTIVHDDVIVIADLKYGAGVMVNVENNLQLILYALGSLAELTPEERMGINWVDTVVMQPRIDCEEGTNRKMRYSIDDIYAWAMWFGERAADVDDPNAPLVPGDSQCMFCDAKYDRGGCSALRDKTLEVFDVVEVKDLENKVLRDPTSLTSEERSLILDYADLIESFIKAVKSTAHQDLENGIKVPGFKLVRGKKGNRQWSDDEEVIKKARALGLKNGDMFDEKLKSPKQLLANAKKAPKFSDKKMEKLESLVIQPDGKLTMAPESDPRPAANSQRIDDAFKDVPQLN